MKDNNLNALAEAMSDQTLFSKIIAGDIPSHKVASGNDWYAFLDIFPRRDGHTLVIPHKQVRNLQQLSDEEVASLFLGVKQVQRRLSKVFDTTDFTYLQHIASQIKTHLNSQAQVLAKPNVIEAINTILQYKHILAYVTADAPYCRVHLDNGRTLPLLRIGIDNLNQYFGDKYLLRIHRSYLVNPKFIHSIERHQRDLKLKLVYGKNSALLPVSRKYAANIRNLGVKEVKIK